MAEYHEPRAHPPPRRTDTLPYLLTRHAEVILKRRSFCQSQNSSHQSPPFSRLNLRLGPLRPTRHTANDGGVKRKAQAGPAARQATLKTTLCTRPPTARARTYLDA